MHDSPILGAGKTPDWAGATPPLCGLQPPKETVGWLQPRDEASQFSRIARAAFTNGSQERRSTCRSSTNHQQIVERKYPVGRPGSGRCRAVCRLDRQHTRSRRQFSRQDDAVERQGLLVHGGKSPRPTQEGGPSSPKRGKSMIQRILNSKNFVACLLAAATGMALYIELPFPEENVFVNLMFLWAPPVLDGLFYSYIVFLFTTPYIAYSILLSGLYVFALKVPRRSGRAAACLSRSAQARRSVSRFRRDSQHAQALAPRPSMADVPGAGTVHRHRNRRRGRDRQN